jgi:LacI family transcriptional regulator
MDGLNPSIGGPYQATSQPIAVTLPTDVNHVKARRVTIDDWSGSAAPNRTRLRLRSSGCRHGYPARVERVKLADVASAAGVHPGTASRALNPETRDQVSRETAKRIVRAAERLGYVPNAQARALRTSRSYLVAIVVPDITNPLFPPMVRGAEHVLTDAGYTVLLTDTDNDLARERRQIESLLARGADGFIIATALWQDPLLQELAAAAVPAVLANRNTSSGQWPYVGGDERVGIALAVEHLTQLGHRRIIHLAGPQNSSTGRERASSFRQAARACGLRTDEARVRVCGSYTEAGGEQAMTRLLGSGAEFTGIVAGNDLIALGVLDALDRAGLRCPEDVSLVGFNDMPFVDKLNPPLTTVRLPLEEMGALAAHTLLTELDRSEATKVRSSSLLPVELVVRQSTSRCPTATVRTVRRRRSEPASA